MIIQALAEYYERKAADPENNMAPFGFEWKEIPFVIVFDKDGKFVRVEDTREGEGKKARAKSFLVPKDVGRAGSKLNANFLWDNTKYALNANNDFGEEFNAFCEKSKNGLNCIKHSSVQSFVKFLDKWQWEYMPKDDREKFEKLKSHPNVTFRLDGDDFLVNVLRNQLNVVANCADKKICSVSGKYGAIPKTHSKIKGVKDAQTAGAAIVSFNSDAFSSFHKEQNDNSPICEEVAENYVKALNHLLSKDSSQKFILGDMSVVFWSAKKTENAQHLEDAFAWCFCDDKDNPDAGVAKVKAMLNSPWTGKIQNDRNDLFYVLGLAPNAARVSIRLWKVGTVYDIGENIRKHFLDIEICHSSEKNYLNLRKLLSHISLEYKIDNLAPNLVGNIFESILNGTPYPISMQQAIIRRIRADRMISTEKVGLLKAYLNRNKIGKEIQVSLDCENKTPSYLLGRLFAVLERIQQRAQPDINSTIKDRYYNSFSATPNVVFPVLMKLKNHHLAKIENRGEAINREKEISDIVGYLPTNLPKMFDLNEQSTFAIGYYHQMQANYKSSENL